MYRDFIRKEGEKHELIGKIVFFSILLTFLRIPVVISNKLLIGNSSPRSLKIKKRKSVTYFTLFQLFPVSSH